MELFKVMWKDNKGEFHEGYAKTVEGLNEIVQVATKDAEKININKFNVK